MSLKVLALRVWRNFGLSQIPGMRKLRQALIPNTRGWDNADKIVQGRPVSNQNLSDLKTVHSPNVTVLKSPKTTNSPPAQVKQPSPVVKQSSPVASKPVVPVKKTNSLTDFRVLSKVTYWSSKLIHIAEQNLAAKVSENAIMVRNLDAPTEEETELYNRILQNSKFIAFRKRHLGLIDLYSGQTDNANLKAVDDLTRMIERFVSKSKQRLLKYGFLISVNPQNVFPISLQQSSYVSKLICIYTPDFEGSVDDACLERADRIICPAKLASSLKRHDIAGVTLFEDASQMEDLLILAIQSFFPKEFDMLLPIWHGFERIDNIEQMSLKKRDLVLKLDCTEKKAPTVTGTFSDYVDALAKHCTAILASESVCQQYVSMIEKLDSKAVRASFLTRAFRDGVRCEIIYA